MTQAKTETPKMKRNPKTDMEICGVPNHCDDNLAFHNAYAFGDFFKTFEKTDNEFYTDTDDEETSKDFKEDEKETDKKSNEGEDSDDETDNKQTRYDYSGTSNTADHSFIYLQKSLI